MFNLSAYFADLTVPVPTERSFLCKKPAVLPPVILFIFLFLFFGSLVFSLFSVLIAVIGLGVKGGDITLVVIFDLYL